MDEVYTISQVADLLSVSKETLRRWDKSNKLVAERHPMNNYRYYKKSQLHSIKQLKLFFDEQCRTNFIKPKRRYRSIELFAGAGGLALGFERAGFDPLLVNEIDPVICKTLSMNRPKWNVINADVKKLDFTGYQGHVDILTGGFPCQAFSYAGHKLGFKDIRGTLFFEFARAVRECKPLMLIGENVRGLHKHDGGRTLEVMVHVLDEIGYRIIPPSTLKAMLYRVPQKRERLLIAGVRKDLGISYEFPRPCCEIYKVKDALKKGRLYPCDVPVSPGVRYPEKKKEVLKLVPPGGYWRDLPIEVQKKYMMKSFYLGGGKTGMARRMSWDEPSLTLTCNPAQKQTERCHPEETRPFTVREYARIQTFPDEWEFNGSVAQQYKQIGNAVPVNFAEEIAYSVVKTLNQL